MSSETGLLEIETLLKKTIGLEIGLLGATAIENALKRRFAVTGVNDLGTYRDQLLDSEVELQALIDAVVVPETWFFRDKDIFQALIRLLPRTDGRGLRLLSLPCATGEEPYSIAITLLEAGWAPECFRIDAMDVSTGALTRAKRALYGRNSFRGEDFSYRNRYFEAAGEFYQLTNTVRRLVHFSQGNLLDAGLFAQKSPYDVIFCRNVLIYFDRPTQEQVLRRIQGGMNADGLLFVGASEQNLAAACDFTSVKLLRSFAFRVGSPAASRAAPVQPSKKPLLKSPIGPMASRPAAAPPPRPLPFGGQIVAPVPPVAETEPLARARRLADQGLFVEAVSLCEALLRQNEPTVELLHLLGLLHDAAGQMVEAVRYYRKALYLDPNHRDTLAHLSLLLHRSHDSSARMLDARLARLNRQEGTR
jgi:chemotaxis protein methyltransferase WspC